VLDCISGSIVDGNRIGLIGVNGSGKSSLLQCIAGLTDKYTGDIVRNCSVEYIPQLDFELYRKDVPLHQYLGDIYEDWWKVFREYEKLFKSKLEDDRILSTLSGGEIVKLSLALALVKSPEVILFDEPTNHLDLNSLKALRSVLINANFSFVIVSHNINFLNSTANTIWEIEKGNLNIYGGNYKFYKEEKNNLVVKQKEEINALNKEINKLQKVSSHKYSQARSLHKKVSSRNPYVRKLAGKKSRNAKILKTETEKKTIELIEKKKKLLNKNAYIDLNTEQKSGLILSINKGWLILPNNQELIKDMDMNIYHENRIAILGDNGIGKTTLIKQLDYNKNKLIKGDITYGSEYKTVYVDQNYDLVHPEKSIFENIPVNNKLITYENVRKVLGNVCFPSDWDIQKTVSTLSGGETARLAFAIATSSDIDLLILDEPTNNLDIDTVEVISKSLREFNGTLIVISHDMHFLKEVDIKDLYIIKNRRLQWI